LRLFIAVKFTPEVKSTLINAIGQLKELSDGNFTRIENLHLTLAFIGESNRKADICKIIDKVEPSPFDISVGGYGHFGNLYWVGLKGEKALYDTAAALRNELKICGIPVDTKPFSPHITIAREVIPHGQINLSVKETPMRVERISLMSSERIDGRLTYKEVYGKNL